MSIRIKNVKKLILPLVLSAGFIGNSTSYAQNNVHNHVEQSHKHSSKINNNGGEYLVVQFSQLPTPKALEKKGIISLNYINSNTIYAQVKNPSLLRGDNNIVKYFELTSKNRISKRLSAVTTRNQTKSINSLIYLAPNTRESQVKEFANKHNLRIHSLNNLPHYILSSSINNEQLLELGNNELVSWVVQGPEIVNVNMNLCLGVETPYGNYAEFNLGLTTTSYSGSSAGFELANEGWDGPGLGCTDLTYYFGNMSSDMPVNAQKNLIIEAMEVWTQHADLTFTETNFPDQNNSIDIFFATGAHGDGDDFTDPTTLAHAYFPPPINNDQLAGDAHFNDSHTFADLLNSNNQNAKDLKSVAIHEFGHSLGLLHSQNNAAIMAPFYAGVVHNLHQDDINGIQAIYSNGVCSGGSTSCISSGNTSGEYISKVELGNLTHTSGASNSGYSDFTNEVANLNAGSTTSIKITPHWTGSNYPEHYYVWIDLNEDGDFADAGENVWSSGGALSNSLVTGNINIPSNTSFGNKTMRVVMSYNSISTPCETYQYGETEDYSIQIGQSDTQSPSTPGNVSANNITSTQSLLSWNPSNDNVGVTGYSIYVDGNFETSVTSSPYLLTGLSASTIYDISIQAFDAAGNFSNEGTTTFTTESGNNGGGSNYCPSNGNTSGEFISKVQIGSISNTSGASSNGYSNYSNQSTNIELNQNSSITITPSWNGTTYPEYYYVWIDFNQDGDFSDNGELAWSTGSATSNTIINGNFTIPSSAELGTTRMRVIMSFENLSTACGDYQYGETEDYSIEISENFGGSGCTDGVTTFPFFDSFEGLTDASWENYDNDDLDWLIGSGTTPSSGTGPSSAQNGSKYIYIEASGSNVGYPNKYASIQTGCFNLSSMATSGVDITFKYHMYGNKMGTLKFEYSSDDGQNWSTLWTKSGNQGNSWKTANILLNSSLVSSNVKFRFKAKTKNGFRSDFAIDAFKVGSNLFKTENTEQVENISQIETIQTFPNPVLDVLNIEMDNLENGYYEIVNIYGQKVQSDEFVNTSINVTNIPTGIYILNIYSAKKTYTSKFIKK